MALKAVAARTEGDVFQGMFFWYHAALLLEPRSRLLRVTIENDDAPGVDDISIEYEEPGVDAGGTMCLADFYQVKCHVDNSSEYSCEALCKPDFIDAKQSMLQRFHAAHVRLRANSGWHRLHLISNWRWASSDKLERSLREASGGALPDKFFTDRKNTAFGRIREMWRKHLDISETEFVDFAQRLRFGVNHFGRTDFRAALADRLHRVGLVPPPNDKMQNVYDSVTQQLLMNRRNSFTRQQFRNLCQREELLLAPSPSRPPALGIRSFVRCAECMEDETTSFVCVAKYFEGRHIRSPELWQRVVHPEVVSFLKSVSTLRTVEHRLLLDCHCSLAFLVGYELDRKSGALVFPVQKGGPEKLWKPIASTSSASCQWTTTQSAVGAGTDVAIAVSVTHNVLGDVERYVSKVTSIGSIVDSQPASGVGSRSVADADHAIGLADTLAQLLRTHRAEGRTIHLFLAVPNAIAFFLGQHRGGLGKVQLYEFDFEGKQNGSYSPSICLSA